MRLTLLAEVSIRGLPDVLLVTNHLLGVVQDVILM
jgi:hypothetical protein